jgi:lysophospholipase L1-like esterase
VGNLARPQAKPGSRPRKILLTGDSMGDGLFVALRKVRKANGFEIKYDPWYGSTSAQWAAGARLQAAIADYQPDLVIFTLGANELFTPVGPKRVAQVQGLVRQFGPTEFVWVGPPNWKKDWGTDSMFRAQVGRARYFQSSQFAFERRQDGAHPTAAASEQWAAHLVDWVNQNQRFGFKFYHLASQAEAGQQYLLQGACF